MHIFIDWAFSLHLEIQAGCAEQMSTDNGDWKKIINGKLTCLHDPCCPNKNVTTKVLTASILWKEFKDFINHSGPYNYQSGWFNYNNTLSGRFHIWHKMHYLLFIPKLPGIGSLERSWSKSENDKIKIPLIYQHSLRTTASWVLISRTIWFWCIWWYPMSQIAVWHTSWPFFNSSWCSDLIFSLRNGESIQQSGRKLLLKELFDGSWGANDFN